MSVLLVRVECLCGTIAAIPEGGFFPLCGRCGRRMVTVPGEDRKKRGLAYVAEMGGEFDSVRECAKPSDEEWRTQVARQYPDEDLRAFLESRGWPTEPCDWPKRGGPDGEAHATPPWELVA